MGGLGMTRRSPSLLATVFVLLFFSSNGQALSVLEVTEEQLVEKAEMIVIGTVVSAYSEKDSGSGDVFTYVTIRITDQLKGKSRGPHVILKTIGGRAGNDIVYIPGAADYFRNEEVLLFLERRPDQSWIPIGLTLGKYSIYRDFRTGRKIVLRHADGNGQYFSTPRSGTVDLQPGDKRFLHDFQARIRKIVDRTR